MTLCPAKFSFIPISEGNSAIPTKRRLLSLRLAKRGQFTPKVNNQKLLELEFQVAETETGGQGMIVIEFLLIEEVAEILKCSVKSVRRRIEAGLIRSFKEGGRICVLKTELEAYLQRQIQATATR